MSSFATVLTFVLTAITVEACIGYPGWLFGRIGHPVTWIGRLIDGFDRAFNRGDLPAGTRRRRGVMTLVATVLAAGGVAWACQLGLSLLLGVLAFIPLGILASSLIAQRSLHDHVARVADGLDAGLDAGRAAVSQIVGRDPQSLDEAGVARAAIESLAENFSDGVVAPAFWLAIGGASAGAAPKGR